MTNASPGRRHSEQKEKCKKLNHHPIKQILQIQIKLVAGASFNTSVVETGNDEAPLYTT